MLTSRKLDTRRVEEFALSRVRESKLPSLVIGLIEGSKLTYVKAFGFRDVDRGLPATPGTVYGLGSVTKSFTALGVLKLVEEGKLSLGDRVGDYVPMDLRVKGVDVTIHHLLTHSSGIPALAYAEAFIRGILGLSESWLPLAKPEDVLTFMEGYEEWVESEPGRKFFYLNEGYVILGLIISRVSGVSYEDFIKENILKPLGMSRTYFSESEVSADPDVATPYVIGRDGKLIPSKFPYGVGADGGLLSNALDMAKYVGMFLGRGSYGGVQVVGEDYLRLMEEKYVDIPSKLFGDEGYGYGFSVTERFLGRKLVGHSGSVLVYTAYMGYLPDEGLGCVVLSNASGYPLSLIGMYVLAAALGANPEEELEPIRREVILKSIEGVYETFKGTYRLEVVRSGDFIAITYRDRFTERTAIYVPEVVEKDYIRAYSESYGRRTTAEFFISGDKVTLILERYKLVRKSPRT